jgi:hypothetical protein
MKLLVEMVDHGQFEYLTEAKEDKKIYKMRGIMMESSIRNKNGRKYPDDIMENEINRYREEKISKRRSYSNVDHPATAAVKLMDASHIVTELFYDRDKKHGFGEIEVLDTPSGKILKVLMDANCQLAVSTRGIGSLLEDNVVGPDYKLLAVDCVSDPSSPNAFVSKIQEHAEYIINEHGDIVEIAVENLEKNLAKHGSRQLAEDLSNFISQLKRKI